MQLRGKTGGYNCRNGGNDNTGDITMQLKANVGTDM